MQNQNSNYSALQKGGLIIPSPIPVADIVLWHRLLKGGKMNGFQFERSQNGNVTTFQCLNASLTILLTKDEAATSTHELTIGSNHVLEFNHKRVLYNLEWVRNEIEQMLNSISVQSIAS